MAASTFTPLLSYESAVDGLATIQPIGFLGDSSQTRPEDQFEVLRLSHTLPPPGETEEGSFMEPSLLRQLITEPFEVA